MSHESLLARLRSGDETNDVEAKRGSEVGKSILETVSAFSNEPGLGGGFLLLGMAKSDGARSSEYEVVGVSDPERIQADLATLCRTELSLPVRPLITLEQVEGHMVVVALIPEAQPHEKPVYIKKRGSDKGTFRRIAATDQLCTDEDIALFYQLRSHHTFDETLIEDATPDDLDEGAINQYLADRARVNPGAAELRYSREDLLEALGATVRREERIYLTIGGLLLFGKELALRRHFPMARADYIRVEGREWVRDPDDRYQTIEMRGPLLTLIPRVINVVLDDIPRAFALGMDQIHRQEVPVVPRTVVREAITNALMHRSYRVRQPVQIIRYSNRLEIRNSGYSLKPADRLGEPGSIARNERVAAAPHEAGLAETKGSGIRVMREAMARANLTAPLFESDRERDMFTVTLLVHHLLGPEELEWLQELRDCNLNEEETRALVVLREVGALNNSAYRDINRVDTNTASNHLRRLRDMGVLDQRGRGTLTYYLPGSRLTSLLAWEGTGLEARSETEEEPSLWHIPPSLGHKARSLGHRERSLGRTALVATVPPELRRRLEGLGSRAVSEELAALVEALCAWRPLTIAELSALTRRSASHLRKRIFRRLLAQGRVGYLYPDNPNHPQQRYTTGPGRQAGSKPVGS